MTDNAHAIYAPSACYRNLSCVGSIAQIKRLGIKQEPSVYAEEGTVAHDWISKALTSAHNMQHFDYEAIPNEEMREHVRDYCRFIGDLNRQFRKVHKGVKHFIEEKVKYDNDFWGTVDYALTGFHKETGAPVVLICDFKYGRGVEVDAEENEQLISYALCFQNQLDVLFNQTHFFIYQPRTPGKEFTRWSVTQDVMASACVSIIKNKKKVFEVLNHFEKTGVLSDQNLKAGEWCRFCPAKSGCSAYLNDLNSTQVKILDAVPEIPAIEVLSKEQKLAIFERRKRFKELLKEIEKDLLEDAIKGQLEGYKVVPSQQKRCWPKEGVDEIAKKLQALGVDEPYKKSLIGIGEVEKQIGKGKIDDLTSLSKPGYQIVPNSDKREEIKQVGLEDLGEIEFTE